MYGDLHAKISTLEQMEAPVRRKKIFIFAGHMSFVNIVDVLAAI